jgi:hypothetical protein
MIDYYRIYLNSVNLQFIPILISFTLILLTLAKKKLILLLPMIISFIPIIITNNNYKKELKKVKVENATKFNENIENLKKFATDEKGEINKEYINKNLNDFYNNNISNKIIIKNGIKTIELKK